MYNFYDEIKDRSEDKNYSASSGFMALGGFLGAILGGVVFKKFLSKYYADREKLRRSELYSSLDQEQLDLFKDLEATEEAYFNSRTQLESDLHHRAYKKNIEKFIDSLNTRQRILWANLKEKDGEGGATALSLIALGGGALALVGLYIGNQIDYKKKV